jgi:hypothetical protein
MQPEWLAFVETYFAAYFTRRDLDATLAVIDPALVGFGTGIDELAREPGAMAELYRRDLQQSHAPIDYRIEWMEGRPVGNAGALIFGVLSLRVETQDGPIVFDGLRISMSLEKQGEVWRMVHHHLSEPTGRQQEGESFPLKELRMFSDRLREEVRSKNEELEARNQALTKALEEVKALSGLIPICAGCKKIRDDGGYWNEVEDYLRRHSEAEFSHGLCPECIHEYYPELRKQTS